MQRLRSLFQQVASGPNPEPEINPPDVKDIEMLAPQSLSFISSLPIEVLEMVFMRTVEFAFEHNSTQKAVEAALGLSHVCAYWRDAALGFPNMWFPVYYKPMGKGTRALSDLFLERGKRTHIRLSNIQRGEKNRRLPLMPTDFRSHVSRLHEISLYMIPWECNDLFREMGARFPSLAHLKVYYDEHYPRLNADEELADTNVLIEAPNVRHLDLEFLHIESLGSFKNLTYLRLSSVGDTIDSNDVVELLIRSPQLRTIHLLDRFHHAGPRPATNKTLRLPYLRNLLLSYLVEDLVPLFQLLMPSVNENTELEIREGYGLEYEELCQVAYNSLWISQQAHELACQLFDEPMSSKAVRVYTLSKSTASFKLSLRWCGSFDTVISFPCLDLSKVTSLSIKTASIIKCHELLPKFANLTRLAIHSDVQDFHGVCATVDELLLASPQVKVLRLAMPKLQKYASYKWVKGMKVSLARQPRATPLVSDVSLYVIKDLAEDSLIVNAHAESWTVKEYRGSQWEKWEL